jgi:hypothetical protein
MDEVDGGGLDASLPDADSGDAAPDADLPDCVTGKDGETSETCCRERCNGRDDDCDGRIDEVDRQSTCHLPYASTLCTAASSDEESTEPTCLIASCLDDHVDCNNLIEDGCESALDSLDHCGLCNHSCSLANASARCQDSECRVDTCKPGFSDCDGKPDNGCEQALDTLKACGACGKSCSAQHAATDCADARCTFVGCSAGYGDCNDDGKQLDGGDGCETDLSSAQNCGACGKTCSGSTPYCSGGKCSSVNCPADKADCDGDNVSCETDLHSTSNCGACGARCGSLANADVSCATGSCVPTCRAGFKNCDNAQQNGCETDVRTVDNCGDCGTSCNYANASTACSDGACRLVGCLAGYGECDDELSGNGCESRLNTNTNCGQCGRSCELQNASETCSSGSCQVASCAAGYGNCDGSAANGCEIHLTNDSKNCGGCKQACGNGFSCQNSKCVCTSDANCGSGQSCCNGSCVDTRSNAGNCGSCGNACASGSGCCSGSCKDLSGDKDNCGSCGNRCDSNSNRCSSGRCRCTDDGPCGGFSTCCSRGCVLGVFCF